MNIEEVRNYALSLPEATEDMPYGPDWVVFRLRGKIFLHIWLQSPEPTCAVKMLPEKGIELREKYEGIKPAYHLNKTHWSDVYLDDFPEDMIKEWICSSYSIILSHLPRSHR